MAWWAAAAAVGGSLLSAYSANKAGEAQASAAKKMARAKRRQAKALLERSEINAERMRASGSRLVGEQQAAFASAGVKVGAGSTLSVMNDAINQTEQGVQDMLVDAKTKADALRSGASADTKLAGDLRTSGQLGAVGSLLSGVSAFSRSRGN